jgi:hypothetical protein
MSDNPEARRPADRPRHNAARNVLLWFGLIALAVVPYPWW